MNNYNEVGIINREFFDVFCPKPTPEINKISLLERNNGEIKMGDMKELQNSLAILKKKIKESKRTNNTNKNK